MMKKIALILFMLMLSGCSSETAGSDVQDTVTFGTYESEKIEWYVLGKQDGKTLLLSVHALTSRPFNDGPATWDNSSLRTWLKFL